ncbi:MAG: preprotein translocase subunit SecY [Candidatus Bathyarchaeota archaeon]|jgi:preprotein translocase SecY subunit|nr:preprotein translocase subunit SecY [Candidatus Bathyarchaeota archaeon A05DMB-5]MDH7557654.1 preprotein translocase subunit SecY [Candidatus Bathyarchaeota archaeon]
MAGRFLNLFKPIARIIPEIKAPERKVRFNEKLFWTALVLIVYLVMSEIPLYGIPSGQAPELAALRVIFASHSGTLMELGIGPIVTAGLILQLLVGSAMIECDMSNPEDRGLFTTASKVFSIVLTGVQASAYIIGGMYGHLEGPVAIVVFLQLIAAGIIVLLLDELLQKGWGFGSGISLFIMAGVAQQIFWDSFALTQFDQFGARGFFVALTQTLASGQSVEGLLIRGGNPSIIGFIATIAAFLVIIYMEGVRVELPLSYAGYRGFRSRYPIKLLYVSNLPVIFASALFANIYLFSQIFYSMLNPYNLNPVINLLGTFTRDANGRPQPSGGLVYYVTAPRSLDQVMADPLRAMGYLGILVAFCIIFSLTWLEVGGLGPSTVSKQLVDAGMQIPGYRRSGKAVESILKRYIPTVTVLGGIIVGLIAGITDFFGVFGSGMGILLSVGIIYQYYEILMQERASEMYPAFRRIFGE